MDRTDIRLFVRARSGDPEAKQALIALHRPQVLAICKNHLRDHRDSVEDVCQETFVRLLSNLERIDPERLPGWLSTVAINQCRKHRRTTERQTYAEGQPSIEADPADRITDRVAVGTLLAGIGGGHAAILTAHYLHDRPVAAIEAERGLAIGSGKVLLHRARKAARSLAEALDVRSLIPLPVARWCRELSQRGTQVEAFAGVAGNVLAAGVVVLAGSIGAPDAALGVPSGEKFVGTQKTQAAGAMVVGTRPPTVRWPSTMADAPPAFPPHQAPRPHRPSWSAERAHVPVAGGHGLRWEEPRHDRRYQVGASAGTQLEGSDGAASVAVYGDTDEREAAYEAACTVAESSPVLTYCYR